MNATTSRRQLKLVSNDATPFLPLIPEQNIHDRRVKKVIQFMKEDLARPMSLESLAAAADISPRQLSRLFHLETEYSPIHYLHELRFAEACFLLGSSWLRVKDICFQVGFENLSNFRNEFKKRKGCSPSKFRQKKWCG